MHAKPSRVGKEGILMQQSKAVSLQIWMRIGLHTKPHASKIENLWWRSSTELELINTLAGVYKLVAKVLRQMLATNS